MKKLSKFLSILLAASALLSLAACSHKDPVYVQSVGTLTGTAALDPGDRFAGMVVAENASEIQKDPEKRIADLKVKPGDSVKKGDPLFSYDTDELELILNKQTLELEQLNATIENYRDQIQELENDRANASSSQQLSYTVEIQSAQISLKEAELAQKAKQEEIEASQNLLQNAVVTAPAAGRIQAVNEKSTDQNGNSLPFIVIQQSDSFLVKATVSELQKNALAEGQQMKVCSRTNPEEFWTGVISKIDLQNPQQEQSGGMFGGGNSAEYQSSKYTFYVTLDSRDGLILGQHVYLTALTEDAQKQVMQLSAAFLVPGEEGNFFVWADKNGKLEKRSVAVGDYDASTDSYVILGGLSGEDYIAFPDEEHCASGVPTTKKASSAQSESVPENELSQENAENITPDNGILMP